MFKTIDYEAGSRAFTCASTQHYAVHFEDGVVIELESQVTELGSVEETSQLAEEKGLPVADFD